MNHNASRSPRSNRKHFSSHTSLETIQFLIETPTATSVKTGPFLRPPLSVCQQKYSIVHGHPSSRLSRLSAKSLDLQVSQSCPASTKKKKKKGIISEHTGIFFSIVSLKQSKACLLRHRLNVLPLVPISVITHLPSQSPRLAKPRPARCYNSRGYRHRTLESRNLFVEKRRRPDYLRLFARRCVTCIAKTASRVTSLLRLSFKSIHFSRLRIVERRNEDTRSSASSILPNNHSDLRPRRLSSSLAYPLRCQAKEVSERSSERNVGLGGVISLTVAAASIFHEKPFPQEDARRRTLTGELPQKSSQELPLTITTLAIKN